jgi:uncharacterized membrane protein
MEQNRFKSPVFWGAIVAQILSILVLTGVFDQTLSDVVQGVSAGVLQILVIVGLLNNPTNSQKF